MKRDVRRKEELYYGRGVVSVVWNVDDFAYMTVKSAEGCDACILHVE